MKKWLCLAVAVMLLMSAFAVSVTAEPALQEDETPDFAKNGVTVQVLGPLDSERYAMEYAKEHPEVLENAKLYLEVRKAVMHFQETHPDAEDGTYSATTGELVPPEEIPGACVTFHQNLAADDPFGGYTDEIYALMCAIAKRELGCKDVYIGYFGNAEVSFQCPDRQKALDFAVIHNQHSVYDPETDTLYVNPFYNAELNPIGLEEN